MTFMILIIVYKNNILICLSKTFKVRIIGNSLNKEEGKKEWDKERKEGKYTSRQTDTDRTYREV